MPGYNKCIFCGNLTRDPEITYTKDGNPFCRFSIAVNRKYKSGDELREEVLFLDVTVFGKQAESCGQFLAKGREVLVDGRLVQDNWEKDGVKHSKHKLIAESVKFLSSARNKTETPKDEVPF